MSRRSHAELIWEIADLLRGPYGRDAYGQVISPFAVLGRMMCVLKESKAAALTKYEKQKDSGSPFMAALPRVSKHSCFNASQFRLENLVMANPLIRDIKPQVIKALVAGALCETFRVDSERLTSVALPSGGGAP